MRQEITALRPHQLNPRQWELEVELRQLDYCRWVDASILIVLLG